MPHRGQHQSLQSNPPKPGFRDSHRARRAPGLTTIRILFLATRDWYNPATTGGDNTLWENARYLASIGHDVTFVAAGFRRAAKMEARDGVNIVRLGGIHSLWFRTWAYYMRRGRGRFDVVVAEGFGGSRIPRLTPLYVREPLLTEWHQVHRDLFAAQYPKILGGPLNLLERTTARIHRDTLVRAGTVEWKSAFEGLGFKPEKIFVVPVSIREDWLLERAPEPVKWPRVMWLGKVRRYKRPDHVIRAMAIVVKQIPEARLIIAGRPDDRAYGRELEKLAADLGLEDHVHFLFNLGESTKQDLIRGQRVLVVPSAVEGFGIVVLEANALGVPVIASNRVPEGAVRHGINGLRYPYGDIAALAASICQVLQDDELYERLSDGGRVFARKFAWRKVGAQYAEIVERAGRKG
jgi:glycosyltransferase involved in cell wall biosynthesis